MIEMTLPKKKTILLDLNATLSQNMKTVFGFASREGSYNKAIGRHETYRQWLVDALSRTPHDIVLYTVRSTQYQDTTLDRIRTETGWLPHRALFNDTGIKSPPAAKQWMLRQVATPRRDIIAIESNRKSREMFARHGIKSIAVDASRIGVFKSAPYAISDIEFITDIFGFNPADVYSNA